MLTPRQVEAVANCIEAGSETEFEFDDAPLCTVLDEIIDHLESQEMEVGLFGLSLGNDGDHEVSMQTPEEAKKAFVHHAMHWAFQLGVGAALKAVGQDIAKNE